MRRKSMVWVLLVLVVLGVLFYFLFCPNPYRSVEEETEVISINVSAAEEEWQEFYPASHRFVVMMPVVPQYAHESVPASQGEGSVQYNMYFAQSRRGTTYLVNVIEYPPSFDLSNVDALLRGVAQEMVSGNSSNQLLKEDRKEILGCPSIDFVIKNDEVLAQTRAMLRGNTLFVLTVMDKEQEYLQTQFARFTNSFHFPR